MKTINTPIKEWQESIWSATFKLTMGIWEVNDAIKNAIEKKPVSEILFLENNKLRLITKMLEWKSSEQEKARSNTVQWFLNDTVELRKWFNWEPNIQEFNWKKYLVTDFDSVYEVSEQIWDAVIWFNPISKKYIIYSLNNKKEIYKWDSEIRKTWVNWYYIINWNLSSIVNINSNWETNDIWTFKLNGLIKKHWNIVYFPHWTDKDEWEISEYLIIKPDLSTNSFEWEYATMKVTLNWKNVLCITSYNPKDDSNSTTVYDCDNWEIIIEKGVNVIHHNYWKSHNWIDRIWNSIKHDVKVPRFKFAKFLKKSETDVIIL